MSERTEKTIEDFFCGCRVGLGFRSYVDENYSKLEDGQCRGGRILSCPPYVSTRYRLAGCAVSITRMTARKLAAIR